ncbi:hypothetical protein FKM95_000055 [Candidatus Tremblaya phenacola]|nr:hypothetical protein FKM95_000055 [Candidatus Tremblaya phenacola]
MLDYSDSKKGAASIVNSVFKLTIDTEAVEVWVWLYGSISMVV